jgi:DNA-binding response OmpR family regulator
MPLVFVIARDWMLRAGVRAELRERGIKALGMESADDAGRLIAAGQLPAAMVIEALPEIAGGRGIEKMTQRVPTLVIASRVETFPLPPVEGVLYRPVRVGDIAERVEAMVIRGRAA